MLCDEALPFIAYEFKGWSQLMIRIISLTIVFLVFAAVGLAQQPGIEKEAWDFAARYDQAILKGDIAFLEKHLDPSFISIGGNSSTMTKEESIENMRRGEKSETDFAVIDLKSFPLKFIVSGNTVVITSGWKVWRKANTAVNAPVQIDKGTTTAVYRKEDKDWVLLLEQVLFDAPPPSDVIGAIGRTGMASFRALVSRNYADLETFLANNYVRVDEDGVTTTREQYLADLRSGKLVIEGLKPEKFYINFRENAAVESGTLTLVGRSNGAAFTKTVEITRRWMKFEDKWRLAAEYFSRP